MSSKSNNYQTFFNHETENKKNIEKKNHLFEETKYNANFAKEVIRILR